MKPAPKRAAPRKPRPKTAAWQAGSDDKREANPFHRLSRTYHLSNEEISRVTGASLRTVAYWNAGKKPQRSSGQKLKEVTRLFDALSDLMTSKAIGPWLQRPNQQFDGSTPLQIMERGESDRLWRMIWQLREDRGR